MISLLDTLDSNQRQVMLEAAALVHKAALLGVIVEITREPLQPLAMGHHQAVINVWTARNQDAKREAMWSAELNARRLLSASLRYGSVKVKSPAAVGAGVQIITPDEYLDPHEEHRVT